MLERFVVAFEKLKTTRRHASQHEVRNSAYISCKNLYK